jgi:hypothetical protein
MDVEEADAEPGVVVNGWSGFGLNLKRRKHRIFRSTSGVGGQELSAAETRIPLNQIRSSGTSTLRNGPG